MGQTQGSYLLPDRPKARDFRLDNLYEKNMRSDTVKAIDVERAKCASRHDIKKLT